MLKRPIIVIVIERTIQNRISYNLFVAHGIFTRVGYFSPTVNFHQQKTNKQRTNKQKQTNKQASNQTNKQTNDRNVILYSSR